MNRFVVFLSVLWPVAVCLSDEKEEPLPQASPPLKHEPAETALTQENQQEIERVDAILAQRQEDFRRSSSHSFSGNGYATEGVHTPP